MCSKNVKIVCSWQCSHSDSNNCPGWAMDCFSITCPDSSRHQSNLHTSTDGICYCTNTSEETEVIVVQVDGKCQNCDN